MLLQVPGVIYLSDFWDFSTLQWCSQLSLEQITQPARQQLHVARAPVLSLIHRLQQHAKDSTNHVVELEQSRETQVPVEHPTVGSIWADPTVSPEVVGAITQVYRTLQAP